MNNVDIVDRIYFSPGDLVRVRHDIDFVPTMWVIEKTNRNVKNANGDLEPIFLGIKCRWFDKNSCLREAIFSTKDLLHVD